MSQPTEQDTQREPGTWIVWRGQLTTRLRLMFRGLAHVLPGGLWIFLLLVLPLLVMLYMGVCQRDEYGRVLWTPSMENIWLLLGWGILGWSADYLIIFGRSIAVASVTTIICVLLAYPVAFFIAARPANWRYFWLCIIAIPLCTNLVVRTYAWMLLLSPGMPPAQAATWLGIIEPDSGLYPSWTAVYIGMASVFLPVAILPIYTSVERIDRSLIEAVRDLYGSHWRAFRHGIFPQTMPGLGAAIVLTFVPALGMFVLPDLLGGGKIMLIGNLLQQQFGPAQDMPFGALIGGVLTICTLLGMIVFWYFVGRGGQPR